MQLHTFRGHVRNPDLGMRSMRTLGPISGLHRGFASRECGQVLHRTIRRAISDQRRRGSHELSFLKRQSDIDGIVKRLELRRLFSPTYQVSAI